jgi:hypothetical protein
MKSVVTKALITATNVVCTGSGTSHIHHLFDPLKPNHNLCKDSVPITKKTHLVSIKKISWLILFREIIAVYSENHTKPVNTR